MEQLERQNPLFSLHGTQSRATATVVPQASRTPGGHHRQLQQQKQRNQEDKEVTSSHHPRGGQPATNQALRPQLNRNNNRGRNHEEVADSRMDARDIINARRQAHLADNFDHFLALSSIFDNIEYPKNFKPMNIQKYDGKQDPAQWLCLYSTAINVPGGDTYTKVLYFPIVTPQVLAHLKTINVP